MFDDAVSATWPRTARPLARLEVPFSASYLARMIDEDEVPTCQALWADLAPMIAPRGCDAEKPVCADGTPVEVGDVMRGTEGRSTCTWSSPSVTPTKRSARLSACDASTSTTARSCGAALSSWSMWGEDEEE